MASKFTFIDAVYFRGHLTAAPLKPAGGVESGNNNPTFPRSPDRGPIEAGRLDPLELRGGDFRGHLTAAPLKQKGSARPPAIPEISAVT